MCKYVLSGSISFNKWPRARKLVTVYIMPVAERFYKNLHKNRMKNVGIVLRTRQTRFKQRIYFKFLCNSVLKIYYKAPTCMKSKVL